MKYLTFPTLILYSTVFVISSAVNFNPSTGFTDYPSVEIKTNVFAGLPHYSATITMPLRTVKKFVFDLEDASDPISEHLFDGLDLRPSLMILSGRLAASELPDQINLPESLREDSVSVSETEIIRQPDNATSTVCRLIPELTPEAYPIHRLQFKPGRPAGWDGTISDIYCTSYFFIENALSELEERIKG